MEKNVFDTRSFLRLVRNGNTYYAPIDSNLKIAKCVRHRHWPQMPTEYRIKAAFCQGNYRYARRLLLPCYNATGCWFCRDIALWLFPGCFPGKIPATFPVKLLLSVYKKNDNKKAIFEQFLKKHIGFPYIKNIIRHIAIEGHNTNLFLKYRRTIRSSSFDLERALKHMPSGKLLWWVIRKANNIDDSELVVSLCDYIKLCTQRSNDVFYALRKKITNLNDFQLDSIQYHYSDAAEAKHIPIMRFILRRGYSLERYHPAAYVREQLACC